MKRLLFLALVALLVLACLGLLASSALAWQAPWSPQPNSAYVIPLSEVFGGNICYYFDSNLNETDLYNPSGPVAIPSGYAVYIFWGFGSPIRGTIQNIPFDLPSSYAVSGDHGFSWSLSAAAALPMWTNVFNAGTGPAFNKENATIWERQWYDQLGTGALADGSYTGSTIETTTRPITDSSFTGDTWFKHAQKKPIKFFPGSATYTFAFTVGQ